MFFFKKILKKKKLFLFFLNGQKNVYFTRVTLREKFFYIKRPQVCLGFTFSHFIKDLGKNFN
jgi:hypothetical protein